MGNLLYHIFFAQPKTINDAAFEYRRIKDDRLHKAIFEIETEDFSDREDIRKKLKALPDPDKLITYKIDVDIIPALRHYLQENSSGSSKLYTNRAILAQTDYFVFKTHYGEIIPLLRIRNTQAESNRVKFYATDKNKYEQNEPSVRNVATCNLTDLWQ
jgi:hypothetical protein